MKLLFFPLTVVCISMGLAQQSQRSDGTALCDFYAGLTAGKSSLTNWCVGSGPYSPCGSGTSTWAGVYCGAVGGVSRVEALVVLSKSLSGSIPSTIGSLLSLTYLDASGNNLSGSLPSQLGLLTNLQGLYLNTNQFTSTVPASYCSFSKSIDLDLDSNPGLTCLPSCLTTGLYSKLVKSSSLTAVCSSDPAPSPSQAPSSASYNYREGSNSGSNSVSGHEETETSVGLGVGLGMFVVFAGLCAMGIYMKRRRGIYMKRGTTGGASSLASQDHQRQQEQWQQEQWQQEQSEQQRRERDKRGLPSAKDQDQDHIPEPALPQPSAGGSGTWDGQQQPGSGAQGGPRVKPGFFGDAGDHAL